MTYRITMMLPCGTRHDAFSLAEANLMISMGWHLVSMRGRSVSRQFERAA